jgi:hypothetical protein
MTEPLPPASDPYRPDPPVAVPGPAPQGYYPTSPVVGSPVVAPALPYGYPAAPPPRKQSKALKIVLISLAAVFALCVSGSVSAFIWVRNTAAQPTGADSPDKAAADFLMAYYRAQDPVRAKKAVCADARDDKKIADQIDEIRRFAGNYGKPSFTWSTPQVARITADKATVSLDLIMTTDDLKASKQQLTLDAVKDKGWWICGVHAQ